MRPGADGQCDQGPAGGQGLTVGELLPLDRLAAVRRDLAHRGLCVVLTNGYFDLLHLGHVRYLQQARSLGDALMVAVNADATARRSKDPRRPILPQQERAEILAALACVDYVTIFAEDTAAEVVAALRPNIYVKGGDYGPGGTTLPEAAAVAACGGRVVLLPFHPGHSTSGLVQTIVERYCAGAAAPPVAPAPGARPSGPPTSP